MPNKETELVLYVELEDPNFEIDGRPETWLQFEAMFVNGTRIRMRQYDAKAGESGLRNIMTIKANAGTTAGVATVDEYNEEISPEFAEGFIRGAETVQHKRRDHLKSNKVFIKLNRGDEEEIHDGPELAIDFDRFIKEDGSYESWAKVDIEIDSLVEWLRTNYGLETISGFSVDFEQLIPTKILRTIDSKTKDPEEKEMLGTLWDTKLKKKVSH